MLKLECIINLLKESLGLLFPGRCAICNRALKEGILCIRCLPLSSTKENVSRCRCCFSAIQCDQGDACAICQLYPTPFRSIRYLWEYRSQAKDLINCIKYYPSLALCKGSLRLVQPHVVELYQSNHLEIDYIVPIPSSPGALYHRGFNFCEQIATLLQASLSHSSIPTPHIKRFALSHTRKRHTQASLEHNKRIHNVKNSFACHLSLEGKRVLLIDDVMTTGATTHAAAAALRSAGALSVDLFVLARSATFQNYRFKLSQMVA